MDYEIAIQKRIEAHAQCVAEQADSRLPGWRRETAASGVWMTTPDAPAYFMSADIAQVIEDAAVGLPDVFSLLPNDAPTPSGYLWIEGGLQMPALDMLSKPTTPWVAFAWAHSYESKGVVNVGDGTPSKGRAGLALLDFVIAKSDGRVSAIDPLIWPWGMSLADKTVEATSHQSDVDQDEEDDMRAWFDRMLRVYATAMIFMRQKILVPHRERTSRAERRRASREGREPEDVFVIRLRATEARVRAAETQGGVEWSRRWIVRGHWRNQWYPSLGINQPKWIGPYIKGPDGKPLLEPEKLFAVTR